MIDPVAAGSIWNDEIFEDAVRICGLSEGFGISLRSAYAKIRDRTDLRSNCEDKIASFVRGDWPAPGDPLCDGGELGQFVDVLAVLSQVDGLVRRHAAKGIPGAVTTATLSDIERWAQNFRRRTGGWGIDQVSWLRHHIAGRLFQLGRLQFEVAEYQLPFRMFRNLRGGRIVALAEAGTRFDAGGWPHSESGDWMADLREDETGITGYPVHLRRGHLSRERVCLGAGEWAEFLRPGDSVLNCHIPEGDALAFEACEASFRQAEQFFGEFFPEVAFHGMVCVSWILDRQLYECLLPTSNLIRFSNQFVPVPVPDANDSQLRERVFGRGRISREELPQTTTLQNAVWRALNEGRKFRLGAGIRPFARDNAAPKVEVLEDKISVTVPMPFQIVIDDVGWWFGADGSERQEPYRTGMDRDHVAADYQAVVDLGRGLDMRPLAGVVLGEWDPDDRIRSIPSASWLGRQWRNAAREGRQYDEAAEIIRNSPDHFEVGLHAIMHEYWRAGISDRAEWCDSDGKFRPREDIVKRIELFLQLAEFYKFGQTPEAFIPCAARYQFGCPAEECTGIFLKYGINSLFTCFTQLHFKNVPHHPWFGIENGMVTVDRTNDPFRWNTVEPTPTVLPDGPVCGMHWPQLLGRNPRDSGRVVQRWVNLIRQIDGETSRILSRNTKEFVQQLLHYAHTQLTFSQRGLMVDASSTFRQGWAGQSGSLLVKVESMGDVALRGSQPAARVKTDAERAGTRLTTFRIEVSPEFPIWTGAVESTKEQGFSSYGKQ